MRLSPSRSRGFSFLRRISLSAFGSKPCRTAPFSPLRRRAGAEGAPLRGDIFCSGSRFFSPCAAASAPPPLAAEDSASRLERSRGPRRLLCSAPAAHSGSRRLPRQGAPSRNGGAGRLCPLVRLKKAQGFLHNQPCRHRSPQLFFLLCNKKRLTARLPAGGMAARPKCPAAIFCLRAPPGAILSPA